MMLRLMFLIFSAITLASSSKLVKISVDIDEEIESGVKIVKLNQPQMINDEVVELDELQNTQIDGESSEDSQDDLETLEDSQDDQQPLDGSPDDYPLPDDSPYDHFLLEDSQEDQFQPENSQNDQFLTRDRQYGQLSADDNQIDPFSLQFSMNDQQQPLKDTQDDQNDQQMLEDSQIDQQQLEENKNDPKSSQDIHYDQKPPQNTQDDSPPPSYLNDQQLFDQFLFDFNIELDSADSYGRRLEIFIKNYQKIRAHNELYYQGLVKLEMAVNQFTHMTEDEMKEFLNLEDPRKMNFSMPVYEMTFDDNFELPNSFNWTEKNVLQPIVDQQDCGSCYAFAAIATIEAQMAIKFNISVKLSEQEAMECTSGCSGGRSEYVYQYSNKLNGCTSESSYPYHGKVEHSCSEWKNRPRVPKSKVNGIFRTGSSVDKTMKAIVEFGPVTAYFAVYHNFMGYSRGVYHKRAKDRRILGYHAVVIVGYGVDRNNQDYWIIRNSWGTSWGMDGYGLFLKGNDECKIESLDHYGPKL